MLLKFKNNQFLFDEYRCATPYSILKAGDDTTNPKHGIRKAKGVPTKIVKKEFHHEQYNKALFDQDPGQL
jgi:hypothetical protein